MTERLYILLPSTNQPFIFDIDGRTLKYGKEDFCLITSFQFGKVNLDPDEEDHFEFCMRVFPKIENLKGEHLLELVKKDVKFAKLDDGEVVQNSTVNKLIPSAIEMNELWWRSSLDYFKKVTRSIPVLRSATKGSSKGKSVHTRVRTEVCHEVHVRIEVSRVHSKEEMILDLQLCLNSVEEKLKPGPSDVDHLDKTDNLSKNAPDCGLDHQSMGGVSQCMNVDEPYKIIFMLMVQDDVNVNSVAKDEIVKDDVNVDSLLKEDIEKDDVHVDSFVKEDIEKDDVQFDSVVKDAEQIENETLPRQKFPDKAYLSPYIQSLSTEVKCRKRRREIKLETVKEYQKKDKIESKPDKNRKRERKPRKGQNRIKTGQKQEACRSREKFKAVVVEKGRKIEENAKRMVENAYT
nr:phospholipase-like protein [Tanacetum cinerariifolium]